jgi:hypothetical protein
VKIAATLGVAILAWLAPGCSQSSGCVASPGPPAATTILFPCNLTLTHSSASGPCSLGAAGNTLSLMSTDVGTCSVSLTFSNGFHYATSIQFGATAGICGASTESVSEIRIGFPLCKADGGACAQACGCADAYDQNGGTVFVDAGVGAPDCGAD